MVQPSISGKCPSCGEELRIFQREIGCSNALTNYRTFVRGKWVRRCPEVLLVSDLIDYLELKGWRFGAKLP